MSKIKISVAIPVYNGERTISETINSVLNQNFINYEINVSVNLSTDNTKAIVEKYEKDSALIRAKYQESKLTMTENIEQCFLMSRGEYTIFLPADDILNENGLYVLDHLAKKYPNASLLQGRYDFIGEDGIVVKRNNNFKNILLGERILKPSESFIKYCRGPLSEACATLVKTENLRVEKLDQKFQRVNIWDLYSRIAIMGGAAITPKLISLYRLHPLEKDVEIKTIIEKIDLLSKQKEYFKKFNLNKYYLDDIFLPTLYGFKQIVKKSGYSVEAKNYVINYLNKLDANWSKSITWPYNKIKFVFSKIFIKKLYYQAQNLISK